MASSSSIKCANIAQFDNLCSSAGVAKDNQIRQIAKAMGLKVEKVKESIQKLLDAGFIKPGLDGQFEPVKNPIVEEFVKNKCGPK